jgi:MFS family permease
MILAQLLRTVAYSGAGSALWALLPAIAAQQLKLGAAGFGNAVGPLLGGLLTDTVGWRWIFFLNLPVAAAAVLIVFLVVPTDADRKDHTGIDYQGMIVLSVALLALLLALDWALDFGWTTS